MQITNKSKMNHSISSSIADLAIGFPDAQLDVVDTNITTVEDNLVLNEALQILVDNGANNEQSSTATHLEEVDCGSEEIVDDLVECNVEIIDKTNEYPKPLEDLVSTELDSEAEHEVVTTRFDFSH